MKNNPVKLDQWVQDILVDPLSKEKLTLVEAENHLITSYGRVYPVINGIYDLRVGRNAVCGNEKAWLEGQIAYEKWQKKIAEQDEKQNYFVELEGVREVYQHIPVRGRCLDVGGHQGRLRAFLSTGQEYISCDPFLSVFEGIHLQKNPLRAYPFLNDPVNFICCEAEHLPFRSTSFDTVHMRSVVDHLENPELAFYEAYRLLRTDGQLLVGLLVRGGKAGRESLKTKMKEIARTALSFLCIDRFSDHHIWHPTYQELKGLIEGCGFIITKTHWQKGCQDMVCYLRAEKKR